MDLAFLKRYISFLEELLSLFFRFLQEAKEYAMKQYLLLIFLSLLVVPKTFAVAIDCSSGASKAVINLPVPSNKKSMTTGLAGFSGQYREIASWVQFLGSTRAAECHPRGGTSAGATHYVTYIEAYPGTTVLRNGSDYIFPTSIKGLGLSFRDMGSVSPVTNNAPVGPPSNPLKLETSLSVKAGRNFSNFPLKFKVSLWKIPVISGQSEIPSVGKVLFNGATIIAAQMNDSAMDYYSATSPNNGTYSLANSWTISSFEIRGELDTTSGTCSLNNKTVSMGSHNMNMTGGISDWKDASFTVQCPAARGYGVDYTLSSNTVVASTSNAKYKNSGLIISVSPLRGATVQDAVNGIITLDGTSSATGYGVQLAWGDISTLPTTNAPPAKAVSFTQAVDAATISDYVTKTYNLGEIPAPQLIKMAARYIRTPGAVAPGTANSAVEVIASYN
ncbi:hypothetical protein KXR87_06770 [Yokenella regensburgei]|uniref:fimbrial protein n=1 Tax=Yokenella regensburgei TaxID=158877 RepID=UPI003F1825D0